MTDFKAVMRRIITGDDADGQSVIILDGGPSASAGDPDVGSFAPIIGHSRARLRDEWIDVEETTASKGCPPDSSCCWR